ncbi:MAG: AarF/ABC1/UbiB kinase family protein, partial [Candidatus Omnitrophota bacterium]
MPAREFDGYYGPGGVSEVDSPILEVFFPREYFPGEVSRQRDLGDPTSSVDVTRFNRSRHVSEDEVRGFVGIIRDSQRSFDEILNDLARIVPPSPYRNFILYCLLVEKKLRDEWGVRIEDDAIYDAASISGKIASLDESKKQQFLELLTQRIIPLLSKDKKIEEENLGVMANVAYKSTKDDARIAEASIIAAHDGEFASYPGLYRAEPGGILAQFDLMVPELASGILAEMLTKPIETKDKIRLISGLLARPSNTRDNHLREVLEKGEPSIRDIDEALPLFYNPHIREKFALRALEMEREESPEKFEALEGELERVTHYFPYLCFNRDDILLNVQSCALTPEDGDLINSLMLQHPDNLRKKTQSQFTFYEDAIREAIKAMNPSDKKDLLLWFMGLRDEKPYNMVYFEYEMRVKLDSLKDRFSGKEGKHYKGVGTSELDDFFVSFLYGEKGILADDNASREFLDALFDAVLPGKTGSIFKTIYDSVFRKRDTDTTTDELRREEVILAMIKKLSQLSRAEGLSGEEKEAAVIRIFLESLGVVGVKLGQFLVSSGLIDEGPIKKALQGLKDSAKPLNKGVVFDAIKKFFGGFYKKFRSLGEEVGSASIKSVYKALLKNGRKGVIKVKRPEAQKKIESDLAFFRRALGDIRDDLAQRDISLPDDMFERIEEMINEEMDFNREAKNQKRLARNLRTRFHPWRGLKRFVKAVAMYFTGKWNYLPQSGSYRFEVPQAIDAGNNSIMIEEFVDGVKLSDMEYIPVEIRRAIANELLRQIFVDGFYHSDPHSGNIFLKDDGKTIVFIDLGSCSEINDENQRNLRDIINGVKNNDLSTIVSAVRTFSPVSEELKSEIDTGVIKSKGSAVNKILKLFNILEKHKIRIPKQLLSIFRFFGSAGYLFEESVPETRGPPSAEQEDVPGEPVIEITDSGAVSFADLSGGKYKTIFGLRVALGSLLSKHGYSEDAEVALDSFFHEIMMNAMKAKGFMRFTDKYGSVESFIARKDMKGEEKYKIVRQYLEEGYKITKLRIQWEINDQNIKIAVSNDSVPDQYHLARIKESYVSSPDIVSLVEEGRFDGDAVATRAFSCTGRGIAIARETAEKAGGSLAYSIENGWTTFSMHVPGPLQKLLSGRTILGILLAGLLTPRLVQAAEVGLQLGQGIGASWVIVPLIMVGIIVFSFLGMMGMGMGGPRLSLEMIEELNVKLKMTLKQLMKITIRIEKEDPVPPEAKVGLEGLKEADRILKEHGAVGIIIGSTAASLYNRRKKDKDLKKHSDIDVVVLTPASQLKKPFEKFEGGIDWWLPEDLSEGETIKDAYNREVKRIFVNGNGVFLRAGVEPDTKLVEVDLPEPGLHLPSRDFAIDLTECVAMALIDPEDEVDTATRAYFRNKIDRDVVRKTMSPVWRKNFAGKVLHKALLKVVEFDLNTVTAINDSTPYVDIEGREKTPKADERTPEVTIPPPPEELKVEAFRQALRYFLRDVFTSEWVDIILASAESYVITGKEKTPGLSSSTYFKKKAGMTLRFVEDPNHGIVGIVEDKGEVIDHITVNYHI